MGHVRETIFINAKPEQVWELGAKAERLHEWQTNLLEVKDVSGPIDHVAAGYTFVIRIAGRRLEGHWEVTRAEKPRLIELKGTAPGGGQGTQTITSTSEGGGTRQALELDYELPGGFLGGIVDRVFAERSIERDIRHSLEAFKALCEAEAKVPA